MAHGRPSEALASYQRALAVRPDCVPALNNRGVALRNPGCPAEALASFDAALEIQPEHLDALNNRGKALVDLGREDEALPSFDKALAIDPRSVRALNKIRRRSDAGEITSASSGRSSRRSVGPIHGYVRVNKRTSSACRRVSVFWKTRDKCVRAVERETPSRSAEA
jgi:tetratricopeptide (TPR) repeat protein